MPVRVLVNLTQPLKRGSLIKAISGQTIKLYFKFERLYDFCYVCGRLGHTIGIVVIVRIFKMIMRRFKVNSKLVMCFSIQEFSSRIERIHPFRDSYCFNLILLMFL